MGQKKYIEMLMGAVKSKSDSGCFVETTDVSGGIVKYNFETTTLMKSWISSNKTNAYEKIRCVRVKDFDIFTDFSSFFRGVSNTKILDLSEFNTKGGTNFTSLCNRCTNTEEVILSSNIDLSDAVSSQAKYMFVECTKLSSLNIQDIVFPNTPLDLASFLENCVNMTYIALPNGAVLGDCPSFVQGCSKLQIIDFSLAELSGATSSGAWGFAFYNCKAVTQAYAKTQSYCNLLNSTSYKAANVNFVVKP